MDSARAIAEVRETIRRFVLTRLAPPETAQLADDESLVDVGVVDSLGIFVLVSFLEATFRILIGDHEIRLDNFRSIEATVQFVAAKLKRQGKLV